MERLRAIIACAAKRPVFQILSVMVLAFAAWVSVGFVLSNEDFYVLTIGNANKAFTFILAGCLVLLLEGYADYRKGIQTKGAFDAVETDGLPLALYFGLRVVGYGILAGFIFG
jgi:hypothetical protein